MTTDVPIDLNRIAYIESSNSPAAYNPESKATGLYQITPIALEDYNNMNKAKLRMDQMYDADLNTRVATWTLYKRIPQMLRSFNLPITTENILASYNAGIGKVKAGKIPKETIEYIRKYQDFQQV